MKPVILKGGRKKPNWRAVFVPGVVWCEKCGRSISNHILWERDVAHSRAGKYRCVDCHPQKVDYK